MKVTVVYAAPGVEAIETLEVASGATVADAAAQSGIPGAAGMSGCVSFAIHGQRARPETPLADGDRIEVLRPLLASPMAARRERAAGHPLPPTRKVKRGRAP